MPARLILTFALGLLLALLAAVPAGAASVAYIDGYNLWLSSPDGSQKFQMTQGGNEDASWNFPSQGPDGTTVVSHRDTFEGGSKRPVLYRYGADGKLDIANVMPVYSGATSPSIRSRSTWTGSPTPSPTATPTAASPASVYRGYWLTFSDNQGAFPSNPQGQSDAYNPTFYGTRVVSSDSGGNIFVQPDVPEAPFTNSYQGWIGHADGYYLSRAEVSPAQNMVAIEWSRSADSAEGIVIARHQGTVPSDIADACDVPVAAASGNLTFSPDGTQMAWQDAEGVKVAGVPNLAAGTETCTLTAPPRVISATGRAPSFGGANVAAMIGGAGGGPAGGPAGRARAAPAERWLGRRRQGREAPDPLPAQAHARRVRQGPDDQGRRRARRADRRLRRRAGQGRPQAASEGRRERRPDREPRRRLRRDRRRGPRARDRQGRSDRQAAPAPDARRPSAPPSGCARSR